MIRRWTTLVLVAVVGWTACPSAAAQQVTNTPAAWRTRAGRMPIGSTVKVQLDDGERLTAVLIEVDEAGLLVKPATRTPEPSRRIAFDRITALDRRVDHVSFGKYAAIGATIAASVFLLLLASVD